MMPNADFRRELPRRRNSGSPTSENSKNANILELRHGEVRRNPERRSSTSQNFPSTHLREQAPGGTWIWVPLAAPCRLHIRGTSYPTCAATEANLCTLHRDFVSVVA